MPLLFMSVAKKLLLHVSSVLVDLEGSSSKIVLLL